MKRLVVCCDGTWNRADQTEGDTLCPTNVVKLAIRIAKQDGAIPQVISYDQGVGTGNAVDRFTGGAFGKGLEQNVYAAYRFLVANYEPGDEIYLFGFSRGAFTARSIGGMIRKCGILARPYSQRYPEALALYRDASVHPESETALQFREQFSCCGRDDVKIKFIGVWDTVGSLGIPLRGLRWVTAKKYQFYDTELSGTIEYAYHALAIDEHRAPFVPTLWVEKPKQGQTVEQVWFAGVHSDVGGGYPEPQLSDVALEWMLQKAKGAGLALDEKTIAAHPITLSVRGRPHESRVGFYELTRGVDRPIGVGGSQSVHPSVLDRWDADRSYRPVNLRQYFREIGDSRGNRA